MIRAAALAVALLCVAAGRPQDNPWLVFEGGDGPGKGKHIVLLSGDEEVAVVLTASRNIEQADENALGADPKGVVEITSKALACEDRGDVGAVNFRENCGDRLGNR